MKMAPSFAKTTEQDSTSLPFIYNLQSKNMSLSIPNAPNAGLFKSGYTSHDSEDAAVVRNIEACRTIASSVQTSLGPYGRNKIVINHLQKMILTSDAATILRELEVLKKAEELLRMGLKTSDIVQGYEKAQDYALQALEGGSIYHRVLERQILITFKNLPSIRLRMRDQ
jgi:chaperonin GroEL (HSP60 family)